jgi:MoaA/NifB/PqqE/SkfB family radical SAM enzyme
MNYHEVRAMVDFALETGVDAVQFTVAYTLPDTTDALLMDDTMHAKVLDQLDGIPEDIRAKAGIHGPGSFLWEIDLFRGRIESPSAAEGHYDGSILKTLPCQIGWFFTIIRANGDVIPCCKGQNRPMGNINDGSFRTIWNSPVYEEFRYNAKILPKSDPYFAPIGCYKMCDNIGQLVTIERNMQRLRPVERLVPIVLPALRRLKR